MHRIGFSLIKSDIVKSLRDLCVKMYILEQGKIELIYQNKKKTYFDSLILIADLEKLARNNCVIQRYKGLGEMDAEQLSSTTMARENRHLLQVYVKNIKKANDGFRNLMGIEVTSRKKFIENVIWNL